MSSARVVPARSPPGASHPQTPRSADRLTDDAMTLGRVETSALEVDELLQQLVGRRDDARVRLETALGDDQVGELARQVHVGHLERAAREPAATARAGRTDLRVAGVDGRAEQRPTGLLEPGRVREAAERDAADGLLATVAERARDGAVGAEGERLQRSGGVAV